MIPYKQYKPQIDPSVFLAMQSVVAGQVTLEADASIWFGAVLRGDVSSIYVGKGTNIQDNTTVHVGNNQPTLIGNNVTVGHNCILHGCTVKDHVIVGMGSTILDGAVINKNTIIGANSLVTMNKVFEEGVLIMGAPAKVVRSLTDSEIRSIKDSAVEYINLAKAFKS